MKSIIRWSLWERRWSILTWSVGIGIYIAINVLVYKSISDQAQAFNQVINKLPATTRALFSDTSDILSPVGYLSAKLYYLILPLLFTILAITLTNHLFSQEEHSGTLELLLSRPVSRSKLLLAKLVSGLIILLSIGLLTLAVTILCMKIINYRVPTLNVVEAHAVTLLLSLLFGSVAWALIGLGRLGHRAAIGAACFVALGSYLFTSLEGIASWLKTPAKLLPYHYFQPSDILRSQYNWWNALGMLIATLIILSIAFVGFRRRDIG